MTASAPRPWWDDFFDDQYADFGLTPRDEPAHRARDAAVEFLVSTLGLSPGAHVFDQCCGIGRMSLPIASQGIRVTGVDVTAPYIQRAQRDAQTSDLDCDFHVGDGLQFLPSEPCDGAFNWFTSFGYHRDDADNKKMLQRAFESLRPGAKYALDYVSVPGVLARFRPCNAVRRQVTGGELLLIEEPGIDFRAGMFETSWTFIHPDGSRRVQRSANRAYMPHELVQFFEETGFDDLQLFGSVDGRDFDRDSRRCIVIGRKPR